MKNRTIVAWITAFLLSYTAWAQQPLNLSGVWELDVAHSDYGDLQGPSSRTDIIEQHDGEIIYLEAEGLSVNDDGWVRDWRNLGDSIRTHGFYGIT